jgi:hypothetical protein
MSVAMKLVGFVLGLVAVFLLAAGIGRAVGPVGDPAAADHGDMTSEDEHETDEVGDVTAVAQDIPKGLMVSQDGYSFRLERPTVGSGAGVPVSFTIEGPDCQVVTDYDVEHEKELHLIAVRRDFTGFQHVHPERTEDGTWSTALDLTSGQWRLFADFKAAGGPAVTLGNDLAVRGAYRPVEPPRDTLTARVDGYTVALDGDLTPGQEARLTLTVSRDGEPVTDLEPYLGAYGHLVALRAGDLAYLHVHPEGSPDDGETQPGPEVVFFTEVPSSDRYHLYLDFKHEGQVRTAAFTVTAGGAPVSPTTDDEAEDGHSGDAH